MPKKPTVIITSEMLRVLRRMELLERFSQNRTEERIFGLRETHYCRRWRRLARDMAEFLKEFE